MKACFKFVATPGSLKLKRDEFITGVPKLYSCQFNPPSSGDKDKKKKTKRTSTSSATSVSESQVDNDLASMTSPITPIGFEIEKLVMEEKLRTQSRQKKQTQAVEED